MKFLFDEIGCDWGIQATVDCTDDTRAEVAVACHAMALTINTVLGRTAVRFDEGE